MLSKKMEKALNEQINKELYSAYLYLAMAAYCKQTNLDGFANWVTVQAQEELAHAQMFFNYVNDRRGRVVLTAIAEPPAVWKTPTALFENIMTHEQGVTASINALVVLAGSEKDSATLAYLQWFVTEQVEEEASVDRVVQRLKMVEGFAGGLFIIDNELATRVFVPPVR